MFSVSPWFKYFRLSSGHCSQFVQIHQPMPQGDDRRLGAVGDAQFRQHLADIVPHRAFGQKEPLGDFGVGESTRHQLIDPFSELTPRNTKFSISSPRG